MGIWLCGVALVGVVEFRRYSMAGGEFSMTQVAWMWLVGSIITGAIGIALLVRELLLHRSLRHSPVPSTDLPATATLLKLARASCRERAGQYVYVSVGASAFKNQKQ